MCGAMDRGGGGGEAGTVLCGGLLAGAEVAVGWDGRGGYMGGDSLGSETRRLTSLGHGKVRVCRRRRRETHRSSDTRRACLPSPQPPAAGSPRRIHRGTAHGQRRNTRTCPAHIGHIHAASTPGPPSCPSRPSAPINACSDAILFRISLASSAQDATPPAASRSALPAGAPPQQQPSSSSGRAGAHTAPSSD